MPKVSALEKFSLPYLTNRGMRVYPVPVTTPSRSFYFSGFFYYGFPLAGRDWRRTRD